MTYGKQRQRDEHTHGLNIKDTNTLCSYLGGLVELYIFYILLITIRNKWKYLKTTIVFSHKRMDLTFAAVISCSRACFQDIQLLRAWPIIPWMELLIISPIDDGVSCGTKTSASCSEWPGRIRSAIAIVLVVCSLVGGC